MAENALTNQTANKSKQDAAPAKGETDFRNLDSKQEAAIVVVFFGTDRAPQIHKHLNEQGIGGLTYKVVRMGKTTNSQVEEALDEFYKLCLTHKTMTGGGLDYVRSVLEKVSGEITARFLLEKISKALQFRPFNFFMKGDPKAPLSLLQHERPQVVAFIMSYTDPEQVARVLKQLPESKRIPTAESMAKMDRVSPEAAAIVKEEMKRKFTTTITSEDNMNLGDVDYVADAMSHVDRSNEERIFGELDKRSPELPKNVRDKMFVLEDILDTDNHSVQCFVRDCDAKSIVYALKSTSDEMQQIFFTNMPKRMVETVRTDLEVTTNVRMKDVEEAQQRIVNIIHRLEDVDEVVINKGGEDDNIFIQRYRPFRQDSGYTGVCPSRTGIPATGRW